MSTLTPEAKSKLSKTIRELRERLLKDFHDAAESAYRLGVPVSKAGLSEENRIKRERLEAWLDEQVRGDGKAKKETAAQAKERYRLTAEKLAAATFLNRIVVIKHMEAMGLIKPAVVTGGWESPAYQQFRDFGQGLIGDDSEGFATLLELLCDELAQDLPGVFGDVGVGSLFPVGASTLRAVIEALDDPELESAWTDDTTLGWVYQYWNDPEREALDDKVKNKGELETHEIAAKTQLFTERYMVEWLLQNSLGQMWLAMCEKQGWTAECRADGTLDRLEERRKDWRAKREAGEVALDSLMPVESEQEHRWKYWVPQPMPKDAVEKAPDTVRTLKLLDPACGSGHFLVIAFDLLFALYQEEAQHRGESWTDQQIAESILENNLHGIDIDPRAVQIAAAVLYLKAKSHCRDAHPAWLNLVAPNLGLARLPKDDPARVELAREVNKETALPEQVLHKVVDALGGADHLGSLLKIDTAIDELLAEYEAKLKKQMPVQGEMWADQKFEEKLVPIDADEARASILARLEAFLDRCSGHDDLGLRLRGEQLAAGVRFVRLVGEGQYDIVIGNPPYQGVGKLREGQAFSKAYAAGRSDLFACFMLRGLELVKAGGYSALLTLSNWMFLAAFSELRGFVACYHLSSLADLGKAAFTTGGTLISTCGSVWRRASSDETSVAVRPHAPSEVVRDSGQPLRTSAALLLQRGRYDFRVRDLEAISEQPVVYWWEPSFLEWYKGKPKLGDETDVCLGVTTGNNARFLRRPWEVSLPHVQSILDADVAQMQCSPWVAYIKGAGQKEWFEPLSDLLNWKSGALELKLSSGSYVRNEPFFFRLGVSFSTIGSNFRARAHMYRSAFDVSGSSVFPSAVEDTVSLMNSRHSREILESLNPTVNFQVGDIKRLPLVEIDSAKEILATLRRSFLEHEQHRETSVEFLQPGPSTWRCMQSWAQRAVDRSDGEPLPPPGQETDDPPTHAALTFGLGVALGRFGLNGEGVVDDCLATALPNGILFISSSEHSDSLSHSSADPIHRAWRSTEDAVAPGKSLQEWLRRHFFPEIHKGEYDNRPIYLPLSSAKRNFVAFIGIHRWADDTLQVLLGDHLKPEMARIEGELADLIGARKQGSAKEQADAEARYSKVTKLKDELQDFIEKVQQCAERGPPPAKPKDTPREVDAPYRMDLDDGVMINSAALWPLLEPQWKDPKRWWSELCNAKGKKDYDWSCLAARYFPKRVDDKCKKDPSLAVAHGCFWKYHAEKAYQWELRLQDEIAPDFTIDEEGSDKHRAAFEKDHADKTEELVTAEHKRREKNKRKAEKNAKGSAKKEKKPKNKNQVSLFEEGAAG